MAENVVAENVVAEQFADKQVVTEHFFERYERALSFFDAEDYSTASRELASLVDEVPDDVALRLRFARALYHSAQLKRAEAQLREVVARDPVGSYAHLMLGRTLERQSRPTEAAVHLRLAAAMAGPTLDAVA